MLRYAVLAVAAGLLAADAKDDARKELKKLDGTWEMVSGEHDGNKIPKEHVKKSRITWKNGEVNVVTPHQSREPIKATVRINAGKDPKEMDWVRSAGPGAGQPM